MRWLALSCVVTACGAQVMPMPDAGRVDAGTPDAGSPDSGTSYAAPTVKFDHSLFWNDAGLLDDPTLISFARLMAAAAPSGNGGPLLNQWFQQFHKTAERDAPPTFIDAFAADAGADPSQWDLTRLQFKVTGVHNRIDKADYSVGGNCGELRASVSSLELSLRPFHMLFIFTQPAGAGDVAPDGHVNCVATARRWAALSLLEGDALRDAVRAEILAGFVHARFSLIETVEDTVANWEWRQWTQGPDPDGLLPFALNNPPLFQQADVEGLNMPGPTRDGFLAWVAANAAALDARTLLIPDMYRPKTEQVPPAGARTPLSLLGLDPGIAAQFPHLRQNFELMGCIACHTADAQFVQTDDSRTPSHFYQQELLARERNLEALARGESPVVPFGPLQPNPVLPQ